MTMLSLIGRGWRRLRHDGVRTTIVYLVGGRLPRMLGVPILSFGQVTPNVFVGSQHGRLGLRWLARQRISHVVNLREEFDDSAFGLTLSGYCYLAVTDGMAPTLEQLRQGVAFIQTAVAAGGRVFIHCHAGQGRAPTLAIAYLITEGMTLPEALARVRSARSFIGLAPEQLARLEEFAALTSASGSGASGA
jgi:hypothetical protein